MTLCVPMPPQKEIRPETAGQRFQVVAFRLNGIENIDADVDQLLDEIAHPAVAVHEDQQVGLDLLGRRMMARVGSLRKVR